MPWLRRAAELRDAGEAFVLATVVAREAPQSARVGDRAIIRADGSLSGWIGGGCVRPTVIREALAALEDARPRLLRFESDVAVHPGGRADDAAAVGGAPAERPGPADAAPRPAGRPRPAPGGPAGGLVRRFPMTCQGEGLVEVYVEPMTPMPELLVLGATPVAEALAALGDRLDYRVKVADPRADAERFPAAEVHRDVAAAAASSSAGAFIVIATMGEGDEEALEASLAADAAYVGLIASSKKAESLFAYLRSRDVPGPAIERIRCPAGLDLGAVTPDEIALSVLAEMTVLRRTGAHGRTDRGEAAPSAAAGDPGSETPLPDRPTPPDRPGTTPVATDPVCGMAVEVEGARHVVEHDGHAYYFCCPHCKAAFEEHPARYAEPTA